MKKQTLHFNSERWQQVSKTYETWWNKKSEKVVIGTVVKSFEPSIAKPDLPLFSQQTIHLPYTVDSIIDTIEYEISQYEFIGDIFPCFNMDCFGPGVVAAFLGCELTNNNGDTGVWFRPRKKYDILDADFKYDADNPVLLKIKEIYKKANERFEGNVLFGMPDLGGIADIASSFFPGEELLLLLYDEPEAVKKVFERITQLWHRFYDELAKDINCSAYGYTDWSGILSSKPSYILQSDFSYMVGNGMFREFIQPHLAEQCKILGRSIYHLDGVGELPHLDSLLEIKELSGIQWVPGANQPPCDCWLDVYEKIIKADKLIQVLPGLESMYKIAKSIEKRGYLQYRYFVYEREMREYAVDMINKIKSL